MSSKTLTVGGGGSGASILGTAFIVMKLTGVIDWSWWWITAPFWGGAAILLVILAIAGLALLVFKLMEQQ